MNNRHMSLKIVSCLKNYCCHNDDNTHIVNLLHLHQLLQKHVFAWVWISTTIRVWNIFRINYKLQVPKRILIKNGIIWKQLQTKVYTYDSDYHILTIVEKDLALHIMIVSALSCITLQSCTITIMYCVTMSPHIWNKNICTVCVPNIWQKLTIYQYHSDKIIPIWGYKRLYDIQFISIKNMLLQWYRLHTKSVALCLKIWTYDNTWRRDNLHISTNRIDKTCCNNYQFVNMYVINNLYVWHWYNSLYICYFSVKIITLPISEYMCL